MQFSQKGIEALKAAFADVDKHLAALQAGAQAVSNIVTKAFTVASVSVMGFVTAGIAASSAGQVLTFQMGQLSRAIAGLFGPEIRAVIDGLGSLVSWFNNLTDSQRSFIAHMALGAAAAAAMAKIVPMLIGAIGGVISSVISLTAAFVGLDVASGGILPIVGAILTALTALAVGTKVGRDGIGGLFEAIGPALGMLQNFASTILKAVAPLQEVFIRIFDQLSGAMGPLLAEVAKTVVKFAEDAVPIVEMLGEVFILVLPLINIILIGLLQWEQVLNRIVFGPLSWLAKVLSGAVRWVQDLFGISQSASTPREQARGGRGALAANVGQFSGDLTAAYFSAATALLAATQGRTGNPAEDQLRATNESNRLLGEINSGIRQQRPEVDPR